MKIKDTPLHLHLVVQVLLVEHAEPTDRVKVLIFFFDLIAWRLQGETVQQDKAEAASYNAGSGQTKGSHRARRRDRAGDSCSGQPGRTEQLTQQASRGKTYIPITFNTAF